MFFQENGQYRCAAYLRLSRSDGDQQESNSIKNQRALLNDYLGKHPELHKVDEYVDDGYSGTNFERPDFKRMMKSSSERRVQEMAFVPVPKDLNRVKTKVMFNLTKRQLICFSIAAAVGVPIFFLAKAHLDLSTAAMLMVVIMLPFIFFALYEKDGQPAEKYLYHIVQSMFIRDKVRPYRTNNLYAEIQQKIKEQEELQLEQQHSKGKA